MAEQRMSTIADDTLDTVTGLHLGVDLPVRVGKAGDSYRNDDRESEIVGSALTRFSADHRPSHVDDATSGKPHQSATA